MSIPIYSRRGTFYYASDSGQYVMADDAGWRPGAFASLETALKASELEDATLQALQDAANERAGGVGGVITLADVSPCGGTPNKEEE